MELKHICNYRADLKEAVDVGTGPFGTRRIAEVTGGILEGPRLNGRVITPGADWILVDGDGVGHIDVRVSFETHDGAIIYAQYTGILILNEKVMAVLSGQAESNFGDTYFMTQPRFETGDQRYQWLNRIVAVAEGRVLRNAVEYRLYECVHS